MRRLAALRRTAPRPALPRARPQRRQHPMLLHRPTPPPHRPPTPHRRPHLQTAPQRQRHQRLALSRRRCLYQILRHGRCLYLVLHHGHYLYQVLRYGRCLYLVLHHGRCCTSCCAMDAVCIWYCECHLGRHHDHQSQQCLFVERCDNIYCRQKFL